MIGGDIFPIRHLDRLTRIKLKPIHTASPRIEGRRFATLQQERGAELHQTDEITGYRVASI